MSKDFLADILKLENSVKLDSSQPCCICLQDFGSLSSETGVIECEIRLPCSHSVGSFCIATWLRSNNTCPVCRHAFFPAQPRPYLEHGIITSGLSRSPLSDWRACCNVLGLSNRATAIAWQLAQKLSNPDWLGRHTGNCVGSVAMYIISHVMGEPKSLEVISPLVRIPADHIRCVYQLIYPRRDKLVFRDLWMDPATLANLQGVFRIFFNGATLEDLLALLPTRTDGNDIIKSYTEVAVVGDREYDLISCREHMDERIDQLCTQLGYDHGLVGEIINTLCQKIAHKIRKTMFLDCRSPQPIIAVSIYMTSHLLCVGASFKQISGVVGVSERTIRTAYRSVYPRRAELVETRFFHGLSQVKILQALAWPALA